MAEQHNQTMNSLHRDTSDVKNAPLEHVDSPTTGKYDGELGADRIALEEYVPGTKAEKQLLRKVDLIMIPSLWFMCVMAYLDRNNIVSLLLPIIHKVGVNYVQGNANAAGMSKDLGLTDAGMI